MTSAIVIAMFAVAISLGVVGISVRPRKTAGAKRQADSDGGTVIMTSDSGADRSPKDWSNTDVGGSDSGGDGGGD